MQRGIDERAAAQAGGVAVHLPGDGAALHAVVDEAPADPVVARVEGAVEGEAGGA